MWRFKLRVCSSYRTSFSSVISSDFSDGRAAELGSQAWLFKRHSHFFLRCFTVVCFNIRHFLFFTCTISTVLALQVAIALRPLKAAVSLLLIRLYVDVRFWVQRRKICYFFTEIYWSLLLKFIKLHDLHLSIKCLKFAYLYIDIVVPFSR
jgi:hypothetical protein